MAEDQVRQHPIDYEIHPVGGWFVAIWGLLLSVGPITRGPGEDSLRFAVELLMGLGVMLLGIAMLVPRGRARRAMVGVWVASVATWLALMVYALVA